MVYDVSFIAFGHLVDDHVGSGIAYIISKNNLSKEKYIKYIINTGNFNISRDEYSNIKSLVKGYGDIVNILVNSMYNTTLKGLIDIIYDIEEKTKKRYIDKPIKKVLYESTSLAPILLLYSMLLNDENNNKYPNN
ncbi:hypothetical protein MJ1_0360 [Nanobdella aerobiophila]|uniref:Uncharacterized protein n=1 Tax=Nanobdella aerobiophila TaxID=2586965 RepID=A0A915SFN6_9ARCH|nr:hypothetical protein [Nanobdella aerobiophila]BBL45524.1 hypothetical protein MJ1_0360 [Nanobdella aerobiophila]